MTKVDNAFPIAPGQFRALALSYRKPPQAEPKWIADKSERGAAWKRTCMLFAKRLVGESPGGPTNYHGSFDCEQVANALPVDFQERARINPKDLYLYDDQLWRKLKRLFGEEWSNQQKRGVA